MYALPTLSFTFDKNDLFNSSQSKGPSNMTELQDELDELIGQPTRVDEEVLRACREKGEFGDLSFNLYREAAKLVWVTCNAYYQTESNEISLTRNQAVCAGLLSRASRLMMSVMKLSSGTEHGETVQILNRCIVESSVDLQFLLKKDDNNIYERFVETGLKGERDLYDIIKCSIRQRNGRELEIEKSMLASINKVCEESGVKIEDIDPKAGSWGGSFRDRLRAIDLGDSYPVLQGITSQSVHGSWSDLIRNYLNKNESGYEPKSDHTQTDGELFGPMVIFATNAAKAYIRRYFDPTDAEFLVQRLDDLQNRLAWIESSRPGWELARRAQ